MKNSKFTAAIATFGLVLFMSITSIANNSKINTGDLTKSTNKDLSASVASETDYSYLRFDVSDYTTKSASEEMELPVSNEYEYLRFNVNTFAESNTISMTELPVDEFDYLRFDVNNFIDAENNVIDDLPVRE
jgi:hypothetical protein